MGLLYPSNTRKTLLYPPKTCKVQKTSFTIRFRFWANFNARKAETSQHKVAGITTKNIKLLFWAKSWTVATYIRKEAVESQAKNKRPNKWIMHLHHANFFQCTYLITFPLVIATHLDQSNYWTNQQHVLGFVVPFTNLSKLCKIVGPKPFWWTKPTCFVLSMELFLRKEMVK